MRRKSNFFLIDVYSAPTIDIINDNTCVKGGPAYYASLALYMVGAKYELHLGIPANPALIAKYLDPLSTGPIYIDGYTFLFRIVTRDDERKLKLLNAIKEYSPVTKGDYALISPLQLEISAHEVTKIVSSHIFSVIDLQGFTRIRLSDGEIINTSMLIPYIVGTIHIANNLVVKLSIEDMNYDLVLTDMVSNIAYWYNLPLVLTMGKHGAIFVKSGECAHIAPLHISTKSIGAGDMLSVLILYGVHKGFTLLEALAKAVAATSCILYSLEEGEPSPGRCQKAFVEAHRFVKKRRLLCNKCCLSNLPISLRQ